jgi:hypothetical protein
MTITLNGTTGITDVNGTAAAPAITGTDTDSGVYFGTNIVALATNGTNAVYVDASQNVGIGSTTIGSTGVTLPASYNIGWVQTAGESIPNIFRQSSTAAPIIASGYKYSATAGGFASSYSSSWAKTAISLGTTSGVISFYTDTAATVVAGTDVTPTERARIDSSGNLLVGTTSGAQRLRVEATASNAVFAYNNYSAVGTAALLVGKSDNNTTTSQIFVQFLQNSAGTGSGQINANGASAAAFGSYSDSRLKENIVELPSQLANIMALRPVEFNYIESEGGGHQIGFIAQEVQTIYPDLIGEREDGMLTLTDLNKNDARLVKAIQEQQALITSLTARIAALEAK